MAEVSLSASSDPGISTDPTYYLIPITLEVDGVLFKLPKHIFVQHSVVFRDMFELPQGVGVHAEGISDSNPIILSGVSKDDFRHLLRVLYPIKNYSLTKKEEWITVLKLSQLWEMNEIRDLAITKISDSHPGSIEKVLLGREHHVPGWLKSGYAELVRQDAPLSTHGCNTIGLECAVLLFQLRESFRLAAYSRSRSYHNVNDAVDDKISDFFKDEITREQAIFDTFINHA